MELLERAINWAFQIESSILNYHLKAFSSDSLTQNRAKTLCVKILDIFELMHVKKFCSSIWLKFKMSVKFIKLMECI